MKKLLCNTLIIMIMLGVFCNGYFGFSGLSFSNRISYAEADNWSSCDTSDLVTAFRYYCKSRNLAIEGSAADALTSFTTTTFNNICSTLGIDPTSLSAELKKTTQGNLGLRFLFSNTGITAYNRIFAEFLQNNDLEVGDSVDNKVINSTKYFTDDDGNSCQIYITDLEINRYIGLKAFGIQPSNIIQIGSYLKYPNSSFSSEGSYPVSFSVNDNIISGTVVTNYNLGNRIGSGQLGTSLADSYYTFYSSTTPSNYINNCISVLYSTSNNVYQICSIALINNAKDYYNNYYSIQAIGVINADNDDISDVDITVNTPNNTVINNNEYNNNWTIIYNDGDTYIDNNDPQPPANTSPGGGGNVDPDPEEPLDPYDPNKPFPDTPDNPTPDPGVVGGPGSDGTITLPDFNFDLPDINWSLDGLQHKFPFSLPFDLYNACKLLNAEPQTPELDYTVNLVVYQWPIQMDLHWLDSAARVIRIFELLAFVVGLILITRHLIGG